jgi:hypothetical protein
MWEYESRGQTEVFASRHAPRARRIEIDYSGAGASITVGPVRGDPVATLLEYPLGHVVCASLLSRLGRGVIVHAAAAAIDGRCVLLAGVSGAGKSTIATLLRDAGTDVFTDERSIVWADRASGRCVASGSPWAGTAGIAVPGERPLAGVFFLAHAESNSFAPLAPAAAATELMRCAFPSFWYRPGVEFALDFCIRLAGEIPCRQFAFRPDRGAVESLRGALRG